MKIKLCAILSNYVGIFKNAVFLILLALILIAPEGTRAQTPTPLPEISVEIRRQLGPEDQVNPLPASLVKYLINVQNLSPENTGPITVEATINNNLVTNITNISTNGNFNFESGKITWSIDDLAGDESFELIFDAWLSEIFPPGSSTLTIDVSVSANEIVVSRDKTTPLILEGAELRIGEMSVENQQGNQDIKPGDAVTISIPYRNVGSESDLSITIIADYPEDLVQEVSAENDGQIESETGTLRWIAPVGSSELNTDQQVQFTITLKGEGEIPPGSSQINLRVEIRSDDTLLAEETFVQALSIENVERELVCLFTEDKDNDNRGDVGDKFTCEIILRNEGIIDITSLSVTIGFDKTLVNLTPEEERADQNATLEDQNISWEALTIPISQKVTLKISGEIIKLTGDGENIQIVLNSEIPGKPPLPEIIEFIPTDQGEATQIEVSQGQGLLKNEDTVVNLLFLYLTFIFLTVLVIVVAIAYGNRSITKVEDRKSIDADAILEYAIVGLILFVVVLLGLQNALDREAINSIIGGIVGYTIARARRGGGNS